MTNQDPSRQSARPRDRASQIKDAANEAFAKLSDVARDAGSRTKQAATETASSMSGQVKGLLDEQIGSGVSLAGAFASSIRVAADDLDKQSPMMASLVRNFAGKVEGYADEFQGQTVDQLARSASRFTRQQPALVFGLAAVAGFFLFRTMKSASDETQTSPPIQPSYEQPSYEGDGGLDHG